MSRRSTASHRADGMPMPQHRRWRLREAVGVWAWGNGLGVVTKIEEGQFGRFEPVGGAFEQIIDPGQLVEALHAGEHSGGDLLIDALDETATAIAKLQMEIRQVVPV